MKTSSINRFSRVASWLLIIYLSLVMTGCSFRPAEISPEEARILQTRDFNGTPEEVAKAVSVVLQEMHYSLGNVDMGLGVLTATRTSERSLAPISLETGPQSDFESELGTFCLVAGTIAVVGLFLAWIFDSFDSDDDDDNEDDDNRRSGRSHRSRSHHHDSGFSIFGPSSSGPSDADSYTYTMTINLEEISLQQTRVRLTVQGEHYEGPSIVESGPVQDQQFFIDFFTRLHTTLNR